MIKFNFYSQVEKSTLDFEKDLIPQFLSANTNEVGLGVFVNIARSFNDIASENILSDTPMVMIGFSIVFTFVIYFLGDFSCLQNRVRILIFLCLKFMYTEKTTKFCKIFPLLLTTVHTVKSKGKILQNFVAFSEYMNFICSPKLELQNPSFRM